MTFDSRLEAQTLAQVERTRIGRDALPGQSASSGPSQRRIIVDFSGGDLSSFESTQPSKLSWRPPPVRLRSEVQPLPDGRGWRAVFRLAPAGNRPADMRLYLTLNGRPLTETWSYVWYPDRVQ